MSLTLQWLAGFFDGEGCVRLSSYKNKKTGTISFCPWVSITNTELPVLKAIQSEFGGFIYNNKSERYYSKAKQSYALVWQGQKALNFLKSIVNYTIVKRTQIELLLSGYPTREGKRGKQLTEDERIERVQLQTQLTDLKRKEYFQ